MTAYTTLKEQKQTLEATIIDLNTELNTAKTSFLAVKHETQTQAKTHRKKLEVALENARKSIAAKEDAERRMQETNERLDDFVKD